MRAEEFTTPKNLAWRIRFRRFKDMDPLLPEREGKMYFLPFDHSAVRTFSNLTGKDHYKIGNMPTEVYEIPGDAMVYDMKIFNSIVNARNYAYNERNPERKKQYEKMIDYHKKTYLDSGVPYSEYKPGMFDYPEILADPNSVRKIEDRGVTYDKNTGQIKLTQRESVNEKWSQKYKRSINCNNPKGFSQRAHCQGRKKKTNEDEDVSKFVKNRLKAAGYKFIGSGYDAQVWMKDEGTVVKILMPKEDNSAHDTFKTFYQLSKKLNSPNLPQFKQVDGREVYNFTINDQPFVQYGMEQLYPLEKGSLDEYVVWMLADLSAKQLDWAKVVDLISKDSAEGMYPNAKKLQKEFVTQNSSKLKEYEIFYNTLRKLHKIGNSKGYGWDPHTENVMRRNDGTLVITDPWA